MSAKFRILLLPTIILAVARPTHANIGAAGKDPSVLTPTDNQMSQAGGRIQENSGDASSELHNSQFEKMQRHHDQDSHLTGYLRSTPARRRRIKSIKSGEGYSKDEPNDSHSDNVFDRHNSSSSISSGKGSKSNKSSKSSKSGKSGKRSKGKGKDGSYPSESSAPTTQVPTISMEPSVAPPPSNLVPTRPRTENPASGPTSPPAGSNEGGQCTPDSSGLFGSQLGFAEVYEYSYEITTIPSVTAEEVDLFVLPNIEMALSQGVLEKLFESCNPDSQTSVNRSPPQTSPPTPTPLNGYVLVGDTYVYQHGSASTVTERNSFQSESYQKTRGRRRALTTIFNRRLQFAGPPQQIEGVSTQPADQVVEGEACVTQEVANLNCFVIRGGLTTYSREKQTDATQTYIQNAIDTTLIEAADDLQDSDNRLIDFDYRDTEQYPLPPVEAPDDDEMPTVDDEVFMGEPTQSPVVRPDSRASEFGEPWHYALIAVGACLIGATIYLCVRRPKNKRLFLSSNDDDDQKDFDEASASEEGSDGDFHQEAAAALAATNLAFGESSNTFAPNQLPQRANAFGTPKSDRENEAEDAEEEESYEIEAEPEHAGAEYDDEEEQSVPEKPEEEGSYELEAHGENSPHEEEDEMNDDGEWVVEEDFEDEPTYDERLNDEVSAFGASQGEGVTAAAAAAAAQGFGSNEQVSFLPVATRRQSYEVEIAESSPVHPKQNSTTSFSVAIARAMNQAAGEKSETDFSPFDQIHDDNIYGATTGAGTEYEFRQIMPMNSSHHEANSDGSNEFEEVSVEDDDEEESEYEIEYATESSGDEFEEDYVSDGDEEEESLGDSYESR